MVKNVPGNRLNAIIKSMHLSAHALARESGVDHSLISKWQQGTRKITKRSKRLIPVAKALLSLDQEGLFAELLAPYRQQGEPELEALIEYLTGIEQPGLPLRTKAPVRQTSGEYIVQYRVFLGKSGFYRAALEMMDYILTLPPNLDLIVLCQGRYEWIVGNLPFTLQLLTKLRKVFQRGTRLSLINRKGYTIAETSAFAWPWLAAHLKGFIRSRYYEGQLPKDRRFVVSIPKYFPFRFF